MLFNIYMNYLRFVIGTLAALLVGCATSGPQAEVSYNEPRVLPVVAPVPAPFVATSPPALAYVAPASVPVAIAPTLPAYPSTQSFGGIVPPVAVKPVYGTVAENGSYYGQLNENWVPKTVAVGGYYRKDGTYVRGHYRSAPGSNPPSTRRRK
jgi:hypothetical protein